MVITIVDEMIVIVGRHAPSACGHRIGSRRVLVCARRGNAGVESSLQQSVHDVLSIVANQETVSHEIIDRHHHLGLVLRKGWIALLHRRPRIVCS